MPILNTPNQNPPGLANVHPSWVYIETNDTVATVTTTGYLTSALNLGWSFDSEQIAEVKTSDGGVILARVSVAPGNIISLTAISVSGNTVISAGSNGVAGEVDIWPATINRGHRKLVAANNTANYTITETNAAFGQATTITTPDPASATANNVLAPAALVNNNLVKASGTAGLVADAGIAASNVQLKTQIKAVSVSWAGGGTSHSFAITGATSSSIIVAGIASAANPSYIVSALPNTGTVDVVFNTDPGAVVINAIAFIVAQ